MNHLVLPRQEATDPTRHSDRAGWSDATETSLNGCFYDHLCNAASEVVGVRYWTDEGVDFEQHPVFSGFKNDERFHFNHQDGHVDIVFDDKDLEAFQKGELTIDAVQDFGGDGVVQKGPAFGIVFNL